MRAPEQHGVVKEIREVTERNPPVVKGLIFALGILVGVSLARVRHR